MIIGGITTKILDNAHCWQGGMAIDSDGAAHCYHLENVGSLDWVANAYKVAKKYKRDAEGNKIRNPDYHHHDEPGFKGWGGGVVLGPDKKPIIQGEGQPAPGFLVSPTSLADPAFPTGDARRYVDSETVPYIAVPQVLRGNGVQLGDLGVAVRLARSLVCGVIVADGGPPGRLGEGSIATAKALEVPSSPRDGGIESGIGYVIFCGSRSSPAWPRAVVDFQSKALELFEAWGGLARLATRVG